MITKFDELFQPFIDSDKKSGTGLRPRSTQDWWDNPHSVWSSTAYFTDFQSFLQISQIFDDLLSSFIKKQYQWRLAIHLIEITSQLKCLHSFFVCFPTKPFPCYKFYPYLKYSVLFCKSNNYFKTTFKEKQSFEEWIWP